MHENCDCFEFHDTGFSLRRLHMGGGGQLQEDKVLMGGHMRGDS